MPLPVAVAASASDPEGLGADRGPPGLPPAGLCAVFKFCASLSAVPSLTVSVLELQVFTSRTPSSIKYNPKKISKQDTGNENAAASNIQLTTPCSLKAAHSLGLVMLNASEFTLAGSSRT